MNIPPILQEELRANAAAAVRRFRKEYGYPHAPVNCWHVIYNLRDYGRMNIEIAPAYDVSDDFDAVTFYDRDDDFYLIFTKFPASGKRGRFAWRRSNFTLAHELGHIYMGHLRASAWKKKRATLMMEEFEANSFAAELLMPREVIGYFCGVQEAADALGVSKAAMHRRMLETNLLYAIRTCPKCGFSRIPPAARYCRMCGEKMSSYVDLWTEEEQMLFQRGKMEELYYVPPAVKSCEICKDRNTEDRVETCALCEEPESNYCFREYHQEPHPCPTDARYCEICGAETRYNEFWE